MLWAVMRGAWLTLPAALLAVVLLLPLAALVLASDGVSLAAALGHPLVRPALQLSLWTSLVSTLLAVLLGTPLAWAVLQLEPRWRRPLQTILHLPMVLPPAVAGLALLLAFGRRGVLGAWLASVDVQVAFTPVAVVLAQLFVAAPLYVQAAVRALGDVDPEVLAVARTLGASPQRILTRVALPLAQRGLWAGAMLAWARALGEFGATLLFAGNLEGQTQTLPLAIYTAFESDLGVARSLALLLLGVAVVVLVVAHRWGRHDTVRTGGAR